MAAMSESTQIPTLPPPPPSTSPSTTIPSAIASTNSSSSSSSSSSNSKIPIRPRKIRKLTSSSNSHSNFKQITESTANFSRPLTATGELTSALSHLRSADPTLAGIIDSHSPPSFQSQSQSQSLFHSLARTILYQQLAPKAASSIYSRFISLCGGPHNVHPSSLLNLSPHTLRLIGVSARKASYLHDLADKYTSGVLSDSSILTMDDTTLFSMLTLVKGIGPWSVNMFMIFSLHRPDVLPISDLGVRKGVQILYGLDHLPQPSQLEQLCDKWKPYRSVGAWYMWRLLDSKGSPTTMPTSISTSIGDAADGGPYS